MAFKDIKRKRARKQTKTFAVDSFGVDSILLAPIMTEKSYNQQGTGVYQFKVVSQANKNDVKAAVAQLYKVTPVDVRIVNVPPKQRMQRGVVRRAYKKAIVTLAPKQEISFT